MSDQYNKVHFETFESASKLIHSYIGFPDAYFYEVIDELDKSFKGEYTAFPYDAACSAYSEATFEHVKKLTKGYKGYKDTLSAQRSRFWDIYMPYLFYKCGKKIFRPTPELVHMLIDTTLKDVDTFFVQSPFKCIFIAIPKEVKLMNPFNIPIDGLYIAVYNKEDIRYEGFSEKYQEYKNYENSKNVVICAVSDLVLHPEDPRETMYYWNMALKEGDLFEQVNTILNFYDLEYKKNTKEGCDERYNRTFLENILSFSINTLLYINSKDTTSFKIERPKKANIENLKNKSKIKKAEKRTQIPYYPIGENIVIDHSYKNVIALYDKDKAQPQRTLIGQWVVRGHWRNQAHGKEFKERKLIWIQPYIKGEEFAEVIEKSYVVK